MVFLAEVRLDLFRLCVGNRQRVGAWRVAKHSDGTKTPGMEVKRSPPNSSKVKRKQSLKANKHSRWSGMNVITKPAPFDICSESDALSSLFLSHHPSVRLPASLLYFSCKQSHSARTIIVITELLVPDSTPQSDIQKSGMASFRENCYYR